MLTHLHQTLLLEFESGIAQVVVAAAVLAVVVLAVFGGGGVSQVMGIHQLNTQVMAKHVMAIYLGITQVGNSQVMAIHLGNGQVMTIYPGNGHIFAIYMHRYYSSSSSSRSSTHTHTPTLSRTSQLRVILLQTTCSSLRTDPSRLTRFTTRTLTSWHDMVSGLF